MPSIGVALITSDKDFECLKGLLPQLSSFDQVVIGHNGKSRKVREYVRHLGKPYQYFRFDWRSTPEKATDSNDWGFSYARNLSFSKLNTDYALWLDADDRIGAIRDGKEFHSTADQTYRAFQKIVTEAPDDIDVWFASYVYSRDQYGNPNVVLSRERLVKLDVGWDWVYPIHEVMVPRRQPKHAFITDVQILHHPELVESNSLRRNSVMLWDWYDQLIAEDPMLVRHDLCRCRWYIGEHYWAEGEYAKAATWFVKEYIAHHPEALSIEKWQAWVLTSKCQVELENAEAAKAAALAAIDIEPGLSDGYIALAQAKLLAEDDPQDILLVLDNAGHAEEPPSQVIQNPMDYTFTPYCIVAKCKYDLGQYESSLEWANKAHVLVPGDRRVEHLVSQASMKVRESNAVEAAKALYKIYEDYEENQKAAELYSILPFAAQRSDEVAHLAEKALHRVRHLNDRDTYLKLYNEGWKSHEPVTENWLDKDAPMPSRLYYILDRLAKALPNGGRILDVGCADGYYSMQIAQRGFEVVGVDIDHRNVNLANERAEKFGFNAKFVQAFFEEIDPEKAGWFHNFDAVICGEVIEHVQNPEFFLGCLVDCAKDNAPIILTTPNESFDMGDIPEGGGHYDKELDLIGHVRIFTQETFEALMKSQPDCHVLESHFIPFKGSPKEGQGWQVGEIRRMPHPEGPVVRFYATNEFCPDDINGKGVGGSETAVIHMARELSDLGCQVVVYSGVNGVWDGVFYRHQEQYSPDHYSDIFIVSRQPSFFSGERPNAKTTVLWCHDLYYPIKLRGYAPNEFPREWIDNIDKILVLSKFHEDYITDVHPTFKGKTFITRNGIDPQRYLNRNIEKVPHKYFYSSSLDRGLDELLEMWPAIRESIPDAELNVAYGIDSAREYYKQTGMTDKLNALESTVRRMNGMDGVIYHGRIGQQELADLQLACEAWLYPPQPHHENGAGGFLETYCVTALEAQAARTHPITRLNGALPEVVNNPVEWAPEIDDRSDFTIMDILSTYADECLLTEHQLDVNQDWALSQTWDSLAKEWLVQLAPVEELVETV